MSKKRANVRPDLISCLFTDGKDYFMLVKCETEPKAVMRDLSNPAVEIERPISFFANFVQLKPVRPIEKPKKPRADLGKTHRKQASTLNDEATLKIEAKKQRGSSPKPETADKKGDNLIIHVPSGLEGDTEYRVNIAGSEASGDTLRLTVLAALAEFNGKIPKDLLTEQERQTVRGILDAGATDARD